MDGDIKADLELVGRIDSVPKILGAVKHITGMGFVVITRTTDTRWIACKTLDTNGVGLRPGDVLDIDRTICGDAQDHRSPVVIDRVSSDPRYAGSVAARSADFESFLSFPIILKNGSVFGTLCAFDPEPRPLQGTSIVETLGFFADLLAAQIDDAAQLSDTRRILRDEKATAELREQFIAVLGHDLRNPVASIASGARMLLQMPLESKAMTIAKLMQGSAIRMNGLIDNLLDFARGRLGDGIVMHRNTTVPLRPVLLQVVDELRTASHHDIEVDLDFEDPVHCDAERIGQLVSNLLANAITHGAVDIPVRMQAQQENGTFILTVINGGEPIPQDARDALFQPFSREKRDSREGLGLGLFIAAEIARGHSGKITFLSTAEETRFTLTIPV